MMNPNRDASDTVLRRLKEASYERMRVELKCSVELLMRDFDMTWDDIGQAMGMPKCPGRAMNTKKEIIAGNLSLKRLNDLAHIFSCESYIIFRPRLPWTET